MNIIFRISFIIFALIHLVACESEKHKLTQKQEQTTSLNDVKIDYVPIGKDSDGCTMYQAQSDTMMTLQVITYENAPGKFSMSKDKQNCL